MTKDVVKPDFVDEKELDDILVYLDELRESGETNMWGAGPYVESWFGLDERQASKIVGYWMQTFGKRHGGDDDAEDE